MDGTPEPSLPFPPALIEVVGAERFEAATAAQRRSPEVSCQEWYDVVCEILEAVGASPDSDAAYVEAVSGLYAQAPSYTVLSQGLRIHRRYEEIPKQLRLLLWQRLRPFLDSPDDRQADPLLYALWEDFFNDPFEEEVWNAIIGSRWPLEERLLRRVLRRSGPVAPHFKYPLYERLLAEQPGRWDNEIYIGLMDALDWYVLRIDEVRVASILRELRLPDQPDAESTYGDRYAEERARRQLPD
jgi:hypothetical protein